ncbi:MAG: hypothetical protein IBX43_09585 [Campylobacterales bacterium]|nr:hypothetical protein [Campylobacterales bacterium]
MKMKDIPLHDIKPLVEVPDNSLLYLGLLGVLGVLALGLLLLWLWKVYKESRKVNLRKHYLESLQKVDLSSAKEAAYTISTYGRLLAQSEREKEMLENLDSRLSSYKYKKEVDTLDEETLAYYQLFLEVLDAS